MAYTQTDLDALQKNMAKGVQSATINGESVVFRSLAEMERMETRIKQALGETPATRLAHTPTTSSGWR